MRTENNNINRAEKLLAVRRLLAGKTSTKALARKLRTPERTVKSWVTLHKNGRLLKRDHHMWTPSWDRENVEVHPLDEDILVGIRRGRPSYEDSIISLMDPEVDAVNGVIHVEWTDDQLDRLLLWMVDRSLELIRDVALGTNEFQEELNFVHSTFFALICKSFGYDVDALRSGVEAEVAYMKVEQTIN